MYTYYLRPRANYRTSLHSSSTISSSLFVRILFELFAKNSGLGSQQPRTDVGWLFPFKTFWSKTPRKWREKGQLPSSALRPPSFPRLVQWTNKTCTTAQMHFCPYIRFVTLLCAEEDVVTTATTCDMGWGHYCGTFAGFFGTWELCPLKGKVSVRCCSVGLLLDHVVQNVRLWRVILGSLEKSIGPHGVCTSTQKLSHYISQSLNIKKSFKWLHLVHDTLLIIASMINSLLTRIYLL
jgi:hypothetical protein